jgi:hypothetical protein
MNDQDRIQALQEYIAYLENRLHHSEKMHDHTMEMLRKLIGKFRMTEHIMKQRSVALVIAMVGKDHADTWWSSPNKAFNGMTPAGQWIQDHESVYGYLMQHSQGAW